MSLRILESLASGHVCHVFATVYIHNISYLSTCGIFQTKITTQTSLFRAMMWRLRIGGKAKSLFQRLVVWWYVQSTLFAGEKTHRSTDPNIPQQIDLLMLLQQLSRSFYMTCCSFFSCKHRTWIIRLPMSPEVVSKASKAAKAMLGMSWLADKSPRGRGRASKRRDI